MQVKGERSLYKRLNQEKAQKILMKILEWCTSTSILQVTTMLLTYCYFLSKEKEIDKLKMSKQKNDDQCGEFLVITTEVFTNNFN